MVIGLDHIGMVVPDCDASLAFYMEHFGFSRGDRAIIPRDGGTATLQFAHLGSIVLEFVQPGAGCEKMQQPPIHFSLKVDDIYAEIKRLQSEGVKFEREDEIPLVGREPKYHNAFFVGPAGERVELMMEDAE